MLERIISGGQAGVERAALDVARELGVAHGGWCARGRQAEDGPIPDGYELRETATDGAAERTERNVVDATATVVFTVGPPTGAASQAIRHAEAFDRPFLHIDVEVEQDYTAIRMLREFVQIKQVRVLHVTGARESHAPEIGAWVGRILREAIQPEVERPEDRWRDHPSMGP